MTTLSQWLRGPAGAILSRDAAGESPKTRGNTRAEPSMADFDASETPVSERTPPDLSLSASDEQC